jgi:hypothetical protein
LILKKTLANSLRGHTPKCKEANVFMHDGAPAHFDRVVKDHLNEQWIGRGGPVSWPPRSPALTPIDFYLWGHLKTVVYATPVNAAEDLWERVQNACQVIHDNLVFERIRQSCIRRAQAFVQNGGQHIGHRL